MGAHALCPPPDHIPEAATMQLATTAATVIASTIAAVAIAAAIHPSPSIRRDALRVLRALLAWWRLR
jgi:hypothetical protein